MSVGALETCQSARRRGLAGRWDGAAGLGLILVTGPDGTDFLHARLTSDVRPLAPGQGQLSAKLTSSGQLVGYFSLHRLPDRGQPFPSYFLLAPRADLRTLLGDLASTVIGEDVILEDVSAQFDGMLLQGPDTPLFLDELTGTAEADAQPEFSIRIPERESPVSSAGAMPGDLMVLARSFTGDPGRLVLWGAGSPAQGFTGRILVAARAAGLAILDTDSASLAAWRWLTVEAGWPCLGRDLAPAGTVLPGTGLQQQVASATKGCYPGQEVVARIRTYGSVPRALRGLEFTAGDPDALDNLPEPGRGLISDGVKIGAWGTGAWSVTRDRMVALAFLDREHRTPGTRLTVATEAGTADAEVVLPPFFRAADQGEKASYLHDRAIHLFSEGDDARAVELLEQALRLDPGLTDAYEALGVILGRGEQYLQAIDIFRRLEEVSPTEPLVHTNLSLFYMKIGDKDEAERQKAQATLKRFAGTTDPAEARALQEAAESSRADEASRRIAMFTEVLEIDPEDPLALMGMGRALADLHQYDRADSFLARALQAQPDNSALYAARGKVLEALDRGAEAGEVYRQGVAVASKRGDLMPLKDMEHRLLLRG